MYVRCSSNQSATIAYVTGCTYAVQPIRARLWRTSRGVRTRFNQSEHGYSVRHASTNQSAAIAYVTLRPIRARHSVRHASTNQSAVRAYVTGCTYAFRPIRAWLWRMSRGVRTLFDLTLLDQSERGVLAY